MIQNMCLHARTHTHTYTHTSWHSDLNFFWAWAVRSAGIKNERLGERKSMYATGSIKHQGGGGGSWTEGCGVKALILSTKLNPGSRTGILENLLIFT